MKRLTIFILTLLVAIFGLMKLYPTKNESSTDETGKQNQNLVSEASNEKNDDGSCEKCDLIKAAISNEEKETSVKNNVIVNAKVDANDVISEPSIPISELQNAMFSGVTYEMLQERFLTEPVNTEWANKIETDFTIALQETDNVEALSDVGAMYEGIDCKSTMCELSFRSLVSSESNKAIRASKIAKVILLNGSFRGMRATIQFTEEQEIKYMLYHRGQ